MKELCLLLFILLSSSCTLQQHKVTIYNLSSNKIDSLLFYANPKCKPLKFSNLKKKETQTSDYINCDSIGGDGSYLIKLYFKNNEIIKSYGYFTNGGAMFDEISVVFTAKDTLIINELPAF